jgi:lysophosphatidate acyltransferase
MSLLNIWLYYVIVPFWGITAALFGASYLFTHYKMPHPAQVAGFFARSMAYLGTMIICATYGVFASIALRALGLAGLSQWTAGKAFKWVSWPLVGIWFDIDEHSHKILNETRPAVFVGNHQT